MPRDLKTAQAELTEARTVLETLAERVRDGDDQVTPEQLATQRELISFAELRIVAAERTETRIREEQRVSLAAAAKTAAEQLITGPGPAEIAAATRRAVDALAALAALAKARNAQISEIGTTLTQLDTDLTAAGETEEPWGTRRYGVWGDRTRVIVPGVGDASQLNLGDLTVTAVVAGLGSDSAGREAAAHHMARFHGMRNQGVRNTLDQVPGLADALRCTQEEWDAADQVGRNALGTQGRRPLPDED